MGLCIATHDDEVKYDKINKDDQETISVLKHGWLEKKSRYLHKWHTRWAVLTPHALYTFKSSHTTSIGQNENGESHLTITKHLNNDITESIDLKQYNVIEDFSWKYDFVINNSELTHLQNIVESMDRYFDLKTSNKKDHIFEFQCTSQKEKTLWCSRICQALGKTDPMLKIQLKKEMSQMNKISIKNECSQKHTTLAFIRTFINIEVKMEADNVPQDVIKMIMNYFFHEIQCCFLSKREPISVLELMIDKDRLNKYALEYSKFRGMNGQWFDSGFNIDRINDDINNQRYPFEITTMIPDNKTFDNQLLKSKDCTYHNNFKPFDLESLGSFPNIKLQRGVIRQIVKSQKIASQRVHNKIGKWCKRLETEKKGKDNDTEHKALYDVDSSDDEADVDIYDWMSQHRIKELEEKKFHLIITKRTPRDKYYAGGYWLHFLDYDCLFVDKESSFMENNSYCIQLPTPTLCIPNESEYIKRKCSFTYDVNKERILLISESMNDILQYELNNVDIFSSLGSSKSNNIIKKHAASLCWSPLNLSKSWDPIKRDSASLCWLTNNKLMIIGGHNQWSAGMYCVKNEVHLLDINANVIIPLRNMRKARNNAASLYLSHSNEVVVGSEQCVEFYDPSKDFWTLYPHETNERYWDKCFIWNDLNNPNILYLGESSMRKNDLAHIEWIDRRENSQWKFLETHKNVSYYDQFYLNPNMF